MSLARFAKRRDKIEPEIVRALCSAGCRTWKLDRPFDLLVGVRGRFVVLEVKSGHSGRVTGEQADELKSCQAGGLPVYLVRSVDDALQAVGAIR